jgi:hypothetical protein
MGVWKGERQAGWRVWPLAGVDRRQGKFERRFLLWPLFHWWSVGLDTKYPTEAFLLFPLWGHIRNANTDHVSVLWPLFSRRTQKDRDLLEVHAPWPFFGLAAADGLDALKVWPLWGERRSNNIRHKFLLWPLYRTKSERLNDLRLTTRNLAVVYWSVEREWVELADSSGHVRCFAPPRGEADRWMRDKRPSADARLASEAEIARRVAAGEGVYRRAVTRRLWPLAHSRMWADGSREFRMLSPLPLATQRYPGEDLYAPFYSIYGYSRSADGTRRESAVLGLYRHERNALARHVNVLGLTDYLRVGTERKRWRLLGGLIEYERDGAQKGFRFLWIPFRRIGSDSGEVAKQGE